MLIKNKHYASIIIIYSICFGPLEVDSCFAKIDALDQSYRFPSPTGALKGKVTAFAADFILIIQV